MPHLRAAAIAILLPVACTTPTPLRAPAEVVLRNARIVTMDREQPFARSMAIAGGQIPYVGADRGIEGFIGPGTEVRDLSGHTVVPGINETHIHVRDLGFEQEENRMATRQELDAVSREIPISLERIYRGIAVNAANLYFEGDSFVRNIGPERMARHTPYRAFRDAGIVMASGFDYPNNSPDPYDDVRSSLDEGKLADLVVLDGDLMAADHEDLLSMSSKVLLTMVGGRVTYRKPGFPCP